jgi:uncharacterized protein
MGFVHARPGQEPAIAALLAREPLYNLFLLANLAECISPSLDVWLHEAGGVLLRNRSRWMLDPGPDPARFPFSEAAAMMDRFAPDLVSVMTGRPEAIDPLYVKLQHHHGVLYQQLFATMADMPAPAGYPATVRPAEPADLDQLTLLYANAGDLSRPRSSVERMLSTAWVVDHQGDIVSAGYVIARTPQAAMVGGIFTPAPLRRYGYASALVHAMSRALLEQGLQPCLFYHNPEAGRIYLRLGYRPLGPWRMVRF